MSRSLDLQYGNFQPDTERAVRAILEPLLWLLPCWCSALYVKFETEPNTEDARDCTIASICVAHSYRRATLRVFAPYFDTKYHDWERREFLMHELVHIQINPIADYAKDQLRLLFGEDSPKFKSSVFDQLTHVTEVAVQDLTMTLMSKMGYGREVSDR